MVIPSGQISAVPRLRRTASICRHQPSGARDFVLFTQAPAGIDTVGYTFNAALSEWTGAMSFPLASPAENTFTALQIDFMDLQFDLKDPAQGNQPDGRFNARDQFLLPGILGSTDPYNLVRFDRDQNGSISQAEIDYFTNVFFELFLSDAASGIFGDLNGDELVDCDDLDLAPLYQDGVLGDPTRPYLPEFDYNLDGRTTPEEKGRLFAIVRPGDVDFDQAVGFSDNTRVLSNFGLTGEPFRTGDANGDGTVNFADINFVLTNWNQSCP